MLTTDILLAMWAVTLAACSLLAYFKGAKSQLERACRFRKVKMTATDEEWMRMADIRRN